MALCESQLDVIPVKRESSPGSEGSKEESPEKKPKMEPNGDIYVPGGMPLAVDYRSPVSHFVPPELYAARPRSEQVTPSKADPRPEPIASSDTGTPVKRKRGRPRVDKTSPEYLANLAARKQAKEMAAVMNNSNESGEKRKRGRPRVDKTSPEYLARKRARELGESRRSVPPRNEALERKAKRENKRRGAGESAASSSTGDTTPRVKRKYTKRTPGTNKDANPSGERVKGKRGRPRKTDIANANHLKPQQPKIRVRSNLMPDNSEPITLDSDDEPDLGSPSQASDSLSLDENLRALRHIHEKYANIDKDDLYEAHLLAANFKKPDERQNRDDDEVLSVRSSEGRASVKELDARVEKLEDSSGSDSDSSSSGSGSSSSGSSSSSSSSSSSDSSDSEAEPDGQTDTHQPHDDDRSFGAWSYSGAPSGSESDPEAAPLPAPARDELSESDNESPDKSFQCHICHKWYSTRVTLKIHRRVHQNRGGGGARQRTRSSDRYECDCCNETFNRREKLWDHKASAHRGAMTVRCEVCKKCFEDDAELAQHATTHSADDRAGRCTDCGLSFQRYDQLARHRQACARASPAASAPHACAQCGKRFTHQHSLTRHAHNHARQLYRCVVCKASFATASQLAQHLNSHLANYKRLKP